MGNATDLSDDDILGIMRLLPFSSLVRAGAVCTRWRRLALVTTPKQHSSWCILSCPDRRPFPTKECARWKWLSCSGSSRKVLGPSCSKSSRRGCSPRCSPDRRKTFLVVMFDPFSRKWLKVANPFGCKDGMFGSPTRELLWVPSTGGYSGLVCVVEWEEESSGKYNVYWVGNPINDKWKCILGPSPWRGMHQLVVNPTTKTYKIISIRWERPREFPSGVFRVHIYDSSESKWRVGATFTVPEPPSGTPHKGYSLSSRTHTASDKMMYLLMYRAGRLMNWVTYTEIRIVGYDIESDEFRFITPLSRFDHCLEYFEPTSCRDWPVHLVLKSDQITNSRNLATVVAERTPNPTHPACLQLVTCSTCRVRPRFSINDIFLKISNVVRRRPRGYHKEFLHKLCIFEFNPANESWEVKEKSSLQVTGKFYSKDRVFHCAGERLEHLYCAHLDEHQSVVVYNAEKGNFSTWSRLPPLGEEYGGFIAKNYHSLGSFIPRLDAEP